MLGPVDFFGFRDFVVFESGLTAYSYSSCVECLYDRSERLEKAQSSLKSSRW